MTTGTKSSTPYGVGADMLLTIPQILKNDVEVAVRRRKIPAIVMCGWRILKTRIKAQVKRSQAGMPSDCTQHSA